MSIVIARHGIFDTVQDNGRYGYGNWGINPCGAMDRFAAKVANALVGNGLDTALLELHFPSSEFFFTENALISLAGANFNPAINGIAVPVWRAISVSKNSVLSFQSLDSGARCYMAIHGGLNLPRWLGSAGTHIKAGAGGIEGRPLKKGDILSLNRGFFSDRIAAENETKIFPWQLNFQSVYASPDRIAFVEGKEWSWLDTGSQENIVAELYAVGQASDRMGYFLKHSPVSFVHHEELISSAVNFGTIQALPGGQFVVLMADHQTTGGYPRIGHIASAHLPKFSQLRVNDKFRLYKLSVEDAEKMVFSLHHDIQMIQFACSENIKRYYEQHRH